MAGRDVRERAVIGDERAVAEREPGDEADALGSAVVKQVFALAQARVEEILHADDGHDLARPLKLVDRHLRQADMADEALILHLPDDTELLVFGHLGVDAVQLPQVDALDTEPAQRHLHALAQVVGPPDCRPLVGALAGETALGSDDHAAVRVGAALVERLAQQVLADEGAIGVGGVDEVDAHIDGFADHADGRVVVGRVTPDTGPGDAHGTEAKAVDGDGIRGAEGELAGLVHGLGHGRIPPWRPPRRVMRCLPHPSPARGYAAEGSSTKRSTRLSPRRPCGLWRLTGTTG